MTFFFNQITTPIYVFCVNVYFLTTFCIFVCSCVCWHHLAINIWLWHMWLHIPCSHVSIVQLSSIRTLWQFFFFYFLLFPQCQLTQPWKLKSLLLFWLYAVKLLCLWLHGAMKCKLSQESLIKFESFHFAFLYEIIFQKLRYCSTSFCLNYSAGHEYIKACAILQNLCWTVNIVPSERKSNQKLCIVLLWTAWPALYLLSAFVNQSLIVKFPKTNPDSAALAAQSKFAGDIIKSSKFPAAQAPQPDETAKIETDYWPCPPSLAALGRLLPLAPPGRLAFWEACKKQTQRQNNDLGNVSTVCLVDMTHHFLSGRSSSLWGVV